VKKLNANVLGESHNFICNIDHVTLLYRYGQMVLFPWSSCK